MIANPLFSVTPVVRTLEGKIDLSGIKHAAKFASNGAIITVCGIRVEVGPSLWDLVRSQEFTCLACLEQLTKREKWRNAKRKQKKG